jgi:type II secretory pathway component PulM
VHTSKHQPERKIALRLARAGRKVDLLVAAVRAASHRINGQVARRVDALRAHEAQVHARLREMRETDEAVWAEHGAELGRLLDELEAQMGIAQARLQAEQATDAVALEAAVHAELDAWCAYADAVHARAVHTEPPVGGRLHAAVRALRARLADACRPLDDLRAASLASAPALDEAVRQALLDLDRAADEIASARGPVR